VEPLAGGQRMGRLRASAPCEPQVAQSVVRPGPHRAPPMPPPFGRRLRLGENRRAEGPLRAEPGPGLPRASASTGGRQAFEYMAGWGPRAPHSQPNRGLLSARASTSQDPSPLVCGTKPPESTPHPALRGRLGNQGFRLGPNATGVIAGGGLGHQPALPPPSTVPRRLSHLITSFDSAQPGLA